MSIADKSLTIDVWGGAISLSLIQGESAGRKIYVTIMDEGDPVDLTGREVRLYVVKPDATVVYTNCDIDDAEQGKVSFVVSSQMVAVSGLGSGEFHVIDADGALLKTPKIGIVIQPSLDVDGAIESSNEYSVLVDLINANASLLAEQVFSGNIEVPYSQDLSGSLEVPLSKQVASGSVLAIRVSRSPSDSRNDQVLFISANRSLGYARYCSAADTLFGYYTSDSGNKFNIFKRDASSSFYIKSIWNMSGLFG